VRWWALCCAFLHACAPTLYSDPGPYAFNANDTTALLSGCGQRAAAGFLYCRFQSGTLPAGEIVVMVPPVECGAESCASVTILAPDGSQALAVDVPKGKTWIVIPWTALVGPGPFQDFQRGFYPVLVRWSWLDATGTVQAAMAEGEIRLRVHHATYTPLTYDPSSQTWTWSVGGVKFGATDHGRGAVLVTP
jgi:hypothetical protein